MSTPNQVPDGFPEARAAAVRAVCRWARDIDLAEEVVAEAVEQYVKTWRDGRRPTSIEAWLITTARRRYLNHVRKARNAGKAMEDLVTISEGGCDHFAGEVARIEIFSVSDAVNPQEMDRHVFRLWRDGYTRADIAKILAISENAAKARLARIFARIRKAYHESCVFITGAGHDIVRRAQATPVEATSVLVIVIGTIGGPGVKAPNGTPPAFSSLPISAPTAATAAQGLESVASATLTPKAPEAMTDPEADEEREASATPTLPPTSGVPEQAWNKAFSGTYKSECEEPKWRDSFPTSRGTLSCTFAGTATECTPATGEDTPGRNSCEVAIRNVRVGWNVSSVWVAGRRQMVCDGTQQIKVVQSPNSDIEFRTNLRYDSANTYIVDSTISRPEAGAVASVTLQVREYTESPGRPKLISVITAAFEVAPPCAAGQSGPLPLTGTLQFVPY